MQGAYAGLRREKFVEGHERLWALRSEQAAPCKRWDATVPVEASAKVTAHIALLINGTISMVSTTAFAETAALVGDPVRAKLLAALMNGRGFVQLMARVERWPEGAPILRDGHTGEIVPGTKGTVASSPVLFGSEAVTPKLEVVVDPAMGGKEALCMARRLEPLHLPFSSSRRLVQRLPHRQHRPWLIRQLLGYKEPARPQLARSG